MYLLQKIPRDYEEKRRSATKGSPIRKRARAPKFRLLKCMNSGEYNL